MYITLLDKSCDQYPLTQTGYSPVYLASQNGYVEVVDLLIDSGAHINLHSQVCYSLWVA